MSRQQVRPIPLSTKSRSGKVMHALVCPVCRTRWPRTGWYRNREKLDDLERMHRCQ